MLVPSIFENNFMDNFFDGFFTSPFEEMTKTKIPGMTVDVKELDDKYQMDIELPGYDKEDIKADIKDGYLTIAANHEENSEDKDEDGRYLRRERYYGQCQRSFFIGENITKDDIHASFSNGILQIDVPKKDVEHIPEKQYIAIEG